MRALIFAIVYFITIQTYSQKVTENQLQQLGLTKKEVSKTARKLLTHDFYWSPVDDFSPFGNDDGSDALYHYREWRSSNQSGSPVRFLKQLLKDWSFPEFNLRELDETEIAKYIETKGGGISESQISSMRAHFKQMVEQSGKEFKEEDFQKIIGMSTSGMGATYLNSIDNAIIAIGFGQFILEGFIDADLFELTQVAIQRELLPVLISRIHEDFQTERRESLNQMLLDLSKIGPRN